MSGIYYSYNITVTAVDGRKRVHPICFETGLNALPGVDKAPLSTALGNVCNGSELLKALDLLAEGPFFTDAQFAGCDAQTCAEKQAVIDNISNIQSFDGIARIDIYEFSGWSDGDSTFLLISLTNKNNPHIPIASENLADKMTTAEWRQLFKCALGNYNTTVGDREGFDKVAMIGEFRGAQKEVVLPRYLDQYKVIDITENTFKKLDFVQSVIIPEGILGIDERAFNQCPNLKTIILPKSLVSIQSDFLYKCPQAVLKLPEGSLAIDIAEDEGIPYEIYTEPLYDYVEEINRFLTSKGKTPEAPKKQPAKPKSTPAVITVGEPSGKPEDFVVKSGKLTKYVGPGGDVLIIAGKKPITEIGRSAFEGCKTITSVVIPDGVEKIGMFAFDKCRNLVQVSLPASVTCIDSNAFYYCSALTSVVIPEGVEIIEKDTFKGCSALASVTLPKSIKFIKEGAFWGCKNLTIYADNPYVKGFAKSENIPYVKK